MCYLLLDRGDIQIQGGGGHGRLEFQQSDNTWGYVCSGGFDYSAAKVACKELGYSSSYYTQR